MHSPDATRLLLPLLIALGITGASACDGALNSQPHDPSALSPPSLNNLNSPPSKPPAPPI